LHSLTLHRPDWYKNGGRSTTHGLNIEALTRCRPEQATSLAYDFGASNSLFGLGWSLSPPAITCRTDKGLHHYWDTEDSDVVLFSWAEDLVPVLDAEDAIAETLAMATAFASIDLGLKDYLPALNAEQQWALAKPTGDRWMLMDATGYPLYAWDMNEGGWKTVYTFSSYNDYQFEFNYH
jgi:hypothetical protein